MTPKQADLIRRSFDAIWPVRRQIAGLFYRRFFELSPDAQRLFPSDMERQHLKLMDMIAAIVGALDKRELFQSIITHTGRQHAHFGVTPLHFVAFGDALIWCLQQQTGGRMLPAEVTEHIVVKTDGNPLFVEELTRAVALDVGAVEATERQGADIGETNPRRLELRPEGEQPAVGGSAGFCFVRHAIR
jgi:hemoglobin-like flavoprotein